MALPNDMQRISEELARLSSADSASFTNDPKKAARNLIRRTYLLTKNAADAMAADTTAYTAAPQLRARCAGRVLGVNVQPQGSLTANDTNYATIKAVKGDGAGGAETIAASVTTQITGGSGNWAAGVTEPLTLSATPANTRYAIGNVISFSIAKSGTGVVVPICSISVDVEEEDVDTYAV